jgi:predicted RNase H-like HicB family nuclease
MGYLTKTRRAPTGNLPADHVRFIAASAAMKPATHEPSPLCVVVRPTRQAPHRARPIQVAAIAAPDSFRTNDPDCFHPFLLPPRFTPPILTEWLEERGKSHSASMEGANNQSKKSVDLRIYFCYHTNMKSSKRIYTYRIIIEPDEHNTFHAYVPALPGCHTWGETFERARKNIRDAIDVYLRSIVADGETIPQDKGVEILEMISVAPSRNKSASYA